MHVIPKPYSRYILISANQFLIPSYYAYICNEHAMALLIFSVYVTSLLLWYNPTDGLRKRVDSTLVASTGVYFLYLSNFNRIVYSGVFCMALTHAVSYTLFYKKMFDLSAYCHIFIHSLGSVLDVYLINYIHLSKMSSPQETPRWTDRCLLNSP